MSIIEKSDVERHRRDINLCRPVSQPDATGFSVAEPEEIKPNPSAFSDDYSREHAIPGKSVTPIGFIGTQAPVCGNQHKSETPFRFAVRAAHSAGWFTYEAGSRILA